MLSDNFQQVTRKVKKMPVGFDIGNSSCFVAVARQGGIETIDNEYSSRNTPAFISFNEKNRSIGVSAKNQCITNLKNTVSVFKRFIGRKFTDPFVQKELADFPKPYKVEQGKNGEILIKVQYLECEQQFTPEQMMAALLTKLKQISEAGLKTKVVDVVVSVPTFFTDIERRAMLNSCEVAGLNCMKVMNDSTAAALGYGIYKQDLPPETEKAKNVVFVDIGYCSLQVAVVAFHKTKLKVLATNFDPCLGGRNFDKILADYFQQDFKERYKVDAGKNMKARLRLETECEKLKKLMSANTQSIPINIECFMDDKDVTGRMDRTQFEELSAGILKRIETVFQSLLENIKMSPSDLAAVEIVGGSSRVPSIKSLVQKVFGIEPSTTLNADEAVARGCSLQNAILNPTFRVRDFSINDAQPYSITLSWQATMEEDSSMELFPKYHMIPMSKVLTFYRTEPFQLEAKYTHKNDVPIPDTNIGKFQVSKIEKPKNEDSAKVKVKVRVNQNGIFTVNSATLSETIEQEEQETKAEEQSMDVDAEKKQTQEEGKTAEGEQKPEVNGETEQMQTDQPETPEKTDNDEKKEENSAGDKKSEKKSEEKKKKKVKKIDLPIEACVPEMSKKEINELVEKENQMIMQDKLEKERADAKNAVEEYVYDMRDKLSEAYEPFVREADREKFSKLLSETEDWLYEEGDDQKKQVYLDKLTQLKNIGIPIKDRYDEFQYRPAAFDELGHGIQHVRKFLDLCAQKDEKFAHISEEDIEKVSKCLAEKEQWHNKALMDTQKQSCYDPPSVLAQQIRSTKQALDTTCNPIMNKPKPKVEPPKEEKKEVKKEGENNGEKMETDSTKPGETPADSPKTEIKPEMDID